MLNAVLSLLTPEVQHIVWNTVDVASTRDRGLLQDAVDFGEFLAGEFDVACFNVVDDTRCFAIRVHDA